MNTRSSRLSGVSAAVKNLIARASGSRASDPEESFSYFVAGRTIRAILGYKAAATREQTKESSEENLDNFEMSAADVEGVRPASCSAEI